MKGSKGRVILSLKRTPLSLTWYFITRSGRGGLSIGVPALPTRPPNSGMSAEVPTGWGPRGTMVSMRTHRTSPFSAPSTAIGPFCGLTNGKFSFSDGLSSTDLIAPPKASSVSATTTSPGAIVSTGAA